MMFTKSFVAAFVAMVGSVEAANNGWTITAEYWNAIGTSQQHTCTGTAQTTTAKWANMDADQVLTAGGNLCHKGLGTPTAANSGVGMKADKSLLIKKAGVEGDIAGVLCPDSWVADTTIQFHNDDNCGGTNKWPTDPGFVFMDANKAPVCAALTANYAANGDIGIWATGKNLGINYAEADNKQCSFKLRCLNFVGDTAFKALPDDLLIKKWPMPKTALKELTAAEICAMVATAGRAFMGNAADGSLSASGTWKCETIEVMLNSDNNKKTTADAIMDTVANFGDDLSGANAGEKIPAALMALTNQAFVARSRRELSESAPEQTANRRLAQEKGTCGDACVLVDVKVALTVTYTTAVGADTEAKNAFARKAQTKATALREIHTSAPNAKKFATELGKAILANTKVKAKYAGIAECTANWEKLQKEMSVKVSAAGTGLTGSADCPATGATSATVAKNDFTLKVKLVKAKVDDKTITGDVLKADAGWKAMMLAGIKTSDAAVTNLAADKLNLAKVTIKAGHRQLSGEAEHRRLANGDDYTTVTSAEITMDTAAAAGALATAIAAMDTTKKTAFINAFTAAYDTVTGVFSVAANKPDDFKTALTAASLTAAKTPGPPGGASSAMTSSLAVAFAAMGAFALAF